MIQGFLAIRKHADRILLLVEMMQGELRAYAWVASCHGQHGWLEAAAA